VTTLTIREIISGGQTGVDRAALKVAHLWPGIRGWGYCPKGRRAEDGPISTEFEMIELRSADYRDRTSKNVQCADAVLILKRRESQSPGTRFTVGQCRSHKKAWYVADPFEPLLIPDVAKWVIDMSPQKLMIAGPRESKAPGIEKQAVGFIHSAIHHMVGFSPEAYRKLPNQTRTKA